MHGRSSSASRPQEGAAPLSAATLPARRRPGTVPPGPNPGGLPHLPGGAAVLYLDVDGAVVVRDAPGRRVEIVHVPRCGQPDDAAYVVRVLDAVGNRAPVLVGGPVDRTAFEREFVAIGHHPERFVEDERLAASDVAELRRRLRRLHAHPG